jgi:hypothetical protein
MDIFSAIVMILADHVINPDDPHDPFKDFLKTVNQCVLPINFDNSHQDVPKKFLDAHTWTPTICQAFIQ